MGGAAKRFEKVAVIGGGGYVGSVLVPRLLDEGYEVVVLDLFIYGEEPLAPVRSNPRLTVIKGDVRDQGTVRQAVHGCEAVILVRRADRPAAPAIEAALAAIGIESLGEVVTFATPAAEPEKDA